MTAFETDEAQRRMKVGAVMGRVYTKRSFLVRLAMWWKEDT